MKMNKEKLKRVYLDIVHSIGWGVSIKDKNLVVDSDDENLQKRINRLNKDEHNLLGELLLRILKITPSPCPKQMKLIHEGLEMMSSQQLKSFKQRLENLII